jgi:hypothetical protein
VAGEISQGPPAAEDFEGTVSQDELPPAILADIGEFPEKQFNVVMREVDSQRRPVSYKVCMSVEGGSIQITYGADGKRRGVVRS